MVKLVGCVAFFVDTLALQTHKKIECQSTLHDCFLGCHLVTGKPEVIPGDLIAQLLPGCRPSGSYWVQPRIPRAIHFAHSAGTQRRDDLIRPKFAPRYECHLFSFAAQFRTTDIGTPSACFVCVKIRNRCPSGPTS
jgi:hypothetical protein